MKTIIEPGAALDTLTRGELSEELAQQTQSAFRQLARGVKYLRFGPLATTVANSAFTLTGSTTGLGPREGFVWSIRRITVWGLATADIANLYRNNTSGIPVWQFTGSAFMSRFGKCELVLLPGETISLVSSGSITATGQVTISGDYVEAAAEEIYKLV